MLTLHSQAAPTNKYSLITASPGRLDCIYSFNKLLLVLKIWWPAKQTAATLTDHVKFLLCIEVVLIKLGLFKKENLISPHHNGRKFKKKKCKKAEEKKNYTGRFPLSIFPTHFPSHFRSVSKKMQVNFNFGCKPRTKRLSALN